MGFPRVFLSIEKLGKSKFIFKRLKKEIRKKSTPKRE